MRVLIACEFSGVVRDAFLLRGHDAWSCDLLPSERPGPHIQGDILHLFDRYGCPNCNGDGCERCAPFDLLIAHPPCTYLASSGLHWNVRRPERRAQTAQALEFVRALMHAPVPRIAIENPVGCISTQIRKPDQIIQPWQFGHDASKATCLWLSNLPCLQPTLVLPGGRRARRANQTPSGQNRLGPSPHRAKERARTYQGIAAAMAEQWGG